MDLEMITPVAIDWNKDGHVDLIVGDEDGRVALIENTGKLAADGTPSVSAAALFPAGSRRREIRRARHARRRRLGRRWRHGHHQRQQRGLHRLFQKPERPGVEKPKWAAPKYLEADGQPSASWPARTAASKGPPRRSGATRR
jgi:hypothetical protein